MTPSAAADAGALPSVPAAEACRAAPAVSAFPDGFRPEDLRGQCWREAFEARRQAFREEPASAAGLKLLALSLEALRERGPILSGEAMLELLLARASLAPEDAAGELAAADSLTADAAEKLLKHAEGLAVRRRHEAKRAFAARQSAANSLERTIARADARWLRTEFPPSVSEVLSAQGPLPWDARHDGHLVQRRAAWALGIVRWARALTRERCQRLEAAFGALAREAGLMGDEARRASGLWAARRPVLLTGRTTLYTEKLVHDLWLADPSIAVVAQDRIQVTNPFARLHIPYLPDPRGFAAALLGADQLPVLIEPRLGGFTATAATGLLALDRMPAAMLKGSGLAVPAWMRTLAEIAALSRWDQEGPLAAAKTLPPARRLRFLKALRALIRYPADAGGRPDAPHEAELIRDVRRRFLSCRETLLLRVAHEETEAEALLMGSRRNSAGARASVSGREDAR